MQFPEDEACQEPIVDDCSPQLKEFLLKGQYRLGEPNKNGRFNIDIKAMKAALIEQGQGDRETFFQSRFNKIS